MNAQRIQELDRIENELSDRLIPASSKADTVGGELLRAIERLIYRYYNDGDIVGEGYGITTCQSSYFYLQDKLKEFGIIELVPDRLNYVWNRIECDPLYAANHDEDYEEALYHLLELVIDFINNDERAKEKNEDDSRTWASEIVQQLVHAYEKEEY